MCSIPVVILTPSPTPTATSTAIVPIPTATVPTPTATATTQSSGLQPKLRIILDMVPDSTKVISYYTGLGNFELDDDGNNSNQYHNQQELLLLPGSYEIFQAFNIDWNLQDIQCTPSNPNVVSMNMFDASITVTTTAAIDVMCTFMNKKKATSASSESGELEPAIQPAASPANGGGGGGGVTRSYSVDIRRYLPRRT